MEQMNGVETTQRTERGYVKKYKSLTKEKRNEAITRMLNGESPTVLAREYKVNPNKMHSLKYKAKKDGFKPLKTNLFNTEKVKTDLYKDQIDRLIEENKRLRAWVLNRVLEN